MNEQKLYRFLIRGREMGTQKEGSMRRKKRKLVLVGKERHQDKRQTKDDRRSRRRRADALRMNTF